MKGQVARQGWAAFLSGIRCQSATTWQEAIHMNHRNYRYSCYILLLFIYFDIMGCAHRPPSIVSVSPTDIAAFADAKTVCIKTVHPSGGHRSWSEYSDIAKQYKFQAFSFAKDCFAGLGFKIVNDEKSADVYVRISIDLDGYSQAYGNPYRKYSVGGNIDGAITIISNQSKRELAIGLEGSIPPPDTIQVSKYSLGIISKGPGTDELFRTVFVHGLLRLCCNIWPDHRLEDIIDYQAVEDCKDSRFGSQNRRRGLYTLVFADIDTVRKSAGQEARR